MLRIGIVGEALVFQNAGIYSYLNNLVRAFSKLNTQHAFYLLTPSAVPPIKGIIQVSIKPRKNDLISRSLRAFVTIPKVSKNLKLDVLIEPAHMGPFNLSKEILRVTVIHDLTPILYPSWHNRFNSFLQKVLLPRILRSTDLIITNSTYTKNDVLKVYAIEKDKVVAIPLGIDERYQPVASPDLILNDNGIYRPYILFIGTIEPRKNLARLIRAFESYCEKDEEGELQLLIAGSIGWKSRNVIDQMTNSKYSDRIILLGYVDDDHLPALISGCSTFVYPSLYEGFGLPVLEALGCGVPVITSNVSSLPEVSGSFTTLIEPENEASIYEALKQCINNPNKNKEEQVSYAHSYSWAKTAKKTLSAIETRLSHAT